MPRLPGIEHAFVLNLDRRKDRLEGFLNRAREAGIVEVERVAAVDGKELVPSPEIRHLFRRNDFAYRRGVLGCALSHYRLWQRIAASSAADGFVAIFEDDACFRPDFLERWTGENARWLPSACNLVYLGGLALPEQVREVREKHGSHHFPELDDYTVEVLNPCFIRPRQMGFCAYAYLLRPSAARLLCDSAERGGIQRAIDGFLTDHWHCLQIASSLPLLCWCPRGDDTDIQLDFETLFDGPGMADLKHGIRTFFEPRAEAFGADDLQRLGWSSRDAQRTRFAVLLDVGPLAGRSVLDVGCGVGDLCGYLDEQGMEVAYTGCDVVARNCADAAARHPGATFLATDLLETSGHKEYDYVLASGIFTLAAEDWHEAVAATLRRMFELCRIGMAANFLTAGSPVKIPGLAYVEPAAILEICRGFTGSFNLRHDYMDNDFTVYAYRG
jgi:GR25 family glycosyltransferase involved in LPS biosynthesis